MVPCSRACSVEMCSCSSGGGVIASEACSTSVESGDGRTVYARETQHGSAAFYTVHKWMSEKDQHKLSNEERGKVMKQYYKDFDALSGEKQQEHNAT